MLTFAIMDNAGEVFWFCAEEVALFVASERHIASDGDEEDEQEDEEDGEEKDEAAVTSGLLLKWAIR